MIKALKLILLALWDLCVLFLPKMRRKHDTYVFMGHAGKVSDAYKQWPFARAIPERLFTKMLYHFWPIRGPKFTINGNNGNDVKVRIVYCTLTAGMMIDNPVRAKRAILRTAKFAWKLGGNLIALGGTTAAFSDYGRIIKEGVPGLNVTTGHAYTTAVVTEHILGAAKDLGIDLKEATVAVVGGGSIGHGCMELMMGMGVKDLLLVDINQDVLDRTSEEYPSIAVTTDIQRIENADIVVVAAKAPGSVISPENLKNGALVIDDGFPPGVPRALIRKRPDVKVVQGGVVKVPSNMIRNFQFGLRRGDAYSCFVEGLILALMGWNKDFNVGRVDHERVERIAQMARALGFKPAFRGSRNFHHEEFDNSISISHDEVYESEKIGAGV